MHEKWLQGEKAMTNCKDHKHFSIQNMTPPLLSIIITIIRIGHVCMPVVFWSVISEMADQIMQIHSSLF